MIYFFSYQPTQDRLLRRIYAVGSQSYNYSRIDHLADPEHDESASMQERHQYRRLIALVRSFHSPALVLLFPAQ